MGKSDKRKKSKDMTDEEKQQRKKIRLEAKKDKHKTLVEMKALVQFA